MTRHGDRETQCKLRRPRDERRRLAKALRLTDGAEPVAEAVSMAATTGRPRGVACASNTDVWRAGQRTPSPTARPRAAASRRARR